MVQTELPIHLERKKPEMMQLLQFAIEHNSAIDVIERLAALQRESVAREAETQFSEALNRVQMQIKRIAPDLENPQKHSKYASYAAIDRVIRPLYSAEGFSLSFTHADCPKPDHIRVICWLRLRGHKEPYQVDWPVDTKGPKGEPVMTATQATGASDSYAKRYLVKDIFNIAIGEGDNDGNITNGELAEQIEELYRCETLSGLTAAFNSAATKALDAQSIKAYNALKEAKNKRKQELSR